jgi:hypothetical protein
MSKRETGAGRSSSSENRPRPQRSAKKPTDEDPFSRDEEAADPWVRASRKLSGSKHPPRGTSPKKAERKSTSGAGRSAGSNPPPSRALHGRSASARTGTTRPGRREALEAIDSVNAAMAKLTGPQNFREGSKASAKGDLELALSHFREAVHRSPSSLPYRKTLRATACRKHRQNLVGSPNASSVIIRLVVLISDAKKKREWHRIDRLAEEGLALNPWHDQLHALAAEANLERRYYEVALFLADTARQLTPGNQEFEALYQRIQEAMRNPAAKDRSIAETSMAQGNAAQRKPTKKSTLTPETKAKTKIVAKKSEKVDKAPRKA